MKSMARRMCIVQVTDMKTKEKDTGNQPRSAFSRRYRPRRTMLYLTNPHSSILHLQSIGQKLVHLGDLGGDAEVDGAVTDLDDEAANQVGVDLNRQNRAEVTDQWK